MSQEAAQEPALQDVETARARVAEALGGVGRVVAVASGKGGVGKSAVAVNLALALAQRGERVGVLDADLQGPSVAHMLGMRGQPVRVLLGSEGEERLRPIAGPSGLAVQGMDFFLEGNQAPDWDGPDAAGATLRSAMEEAALVDLVAHTRWGELDWLVVDLPPGADRLPAFCRWLPERSVSIAVTIPSRVALLAVERSLRRALTARLPLLGLVENCASVTCQACGAETPLYPDGDAGALARRLGLPLLARIPFDAALAEAADAGRPFLEGPARATAAGVALAGLAERLATQHHPEMDSDREDRT